MRQLRLLLTMVVVIGMIILFNTSPVAAIGQPFEDGNIFFGVEYVDSAPIVEYSTTALSVRENVSSVIVTVLLRSPSNDTTSVNYMTSDGTATAGSDYTTTSGTLTFAPGETFKTFTVQIQNDTADESNEIINLALSDPFQATLGPISTATITIEDDDIVASVAFDLSRITVHENVGTVNVEVELKSISNNPITVDYTTSNGSATADSDYTANSGTLTFAPGQSRQSFTIFIADDTAPEPNETINLMLSNPTNAILGTTNHSLITISASDSLSFSGNINVAEYADAAIMTVRLNAPSSSTVTVDYATSDGSARVGSDYIATSGMLTFAPGQTTQTISIPLVNDLEGEVNETVFVTLTNPTNASIGSPSIVTATINANDKISFGGNISVHENVGTATLTVKLNGPSNLPVTVDYLTTDNTARAGSDYTATSGTLTFEPGQTTQTFTVPLIDDLLGEVSENFTAALRNSTNAVISPMPDATVTINANDRVAFGGNVSVHENAGTATLTVKLNGPSNLPVTVDYLTTDNTARAGSDYTATSGTLTFEPGQTTQTFTVPLIDDLLGEVSENFTLALRNSTNADITEPSGATVTINASDMVSFGASTYRVAENIASATITVRLNSPSNSIVSVDYATSNINAIAGSDYTATSGTLTFAPGQTIQTFVVPIIDDALDEPNELVAIEFSNLVNVTLGPSSSTTLTIVDND